MIKKITIYLSLCLFSVINAQQNKGDLVDGIAAVVGNEIILESEVLEEYNFAKQQNPAIDKCEIFEGILNKKILIHEAKQDTLIDPQTEAIKEQALRKYNGILSQFPSEREMLKKYKFRTAHQMKKVIEKMDAEQYLMGEKYRMVTTGVDVTPQEVSEFYDVYQFQLPQVKDEVKIANIAIYPELTESHKQELINKLNKIKADILNGEDFASQARIYSEDPGSAANGGLMKNIYKGQMVKPFEAAALNLQVGEISEPIESEYGFHIIKLERKSGKIYDASHILLMAEPTEGEIATAKAKLDSIKTLIKLDKMSFKKAAYKFSDDKSTKYNAGILQGRDGSARVEKDALGADVAYQIAGLHKGDLTEVFEDELNKRKVVKLIRLEEETPAHQMTLKSDYDRVKSYAVKKKQNELLEKWIETRIPHIFISIDKRYKNCTFKNKWGK
ncbi:MAG: peptidylprolyl isomerase [Flavobacteriales bacterium]|nr:MAG: peptidylprolyl isomerase [Flavobacteriales bacterium]